MLSAIDLLYMVLAVAATLLAILFSILIIYAILILRDVNKASEAVRASADRVNKMLIAPLKMTNELVKMAKPVIEVAEKAAKKQSNKRSSRKK